MPPPVRHVWRGLVLIAGGLALMLYLALLLVTTYLAQQRLVDSTVARQRLELTLRASTLSYFYAERRSDLANLRRHPSIAAFFDNRDLGMSMQYGLQTSLSAVHESILELLAENRVGTERVYTRIALFDADGTALVETTADPPLGLDWSPTDTDESTDVRLIVDAANHPDWVLVQAPVVLAGRIRGTLVAWVNEAAALTVLAGLEHAVDGQDRYRVRWVDQGDPSPRALGEMAVPIAGTPFFLLDARPTPVEGGLLYSRWFLIALVLLALAFLAGGALLLRFNRQNLILRTRMDVVRHQRRELTAQNERLMQEIEKREEYERRLTYQANYDVLTGLPNRALALDRLGQDLTVSFRERRGVLVFFLDLDHFKRVNDSLGHDAGNRLLAQVAERAQSLVAAGDTLARVAADEFIFLYPDLPASIDAGSHAERIMRLFATPFMIEEREIHLTASLGSAMSPRDGKTAELLLKNAGLAMKEAKESGRNTYCIYQQGLDQRLREKLSIASLLRRAAERAELHLVFQPLIDLRTGRTVAAEALLRWQHHELGLVPPAQFIPIAEESGLIRELGAWALEQACATAASWQSIAPCRVAVNVSSLQLQAASEFRDTVERALAGSGLSPALLELEITEGVLLRDHPSITHLLSGLERQGVRLSLDDFGTGYSALSYLRRFPFHVLKIDRSFISGVPDDPEDAELTRAIIAMAQALNMAVLAEGIEHADQLDFLTAQGCDLAQGFLFSRPLTAEGFLEFLRADGCRATEQGGVK